MEWGHGDTEMGTGLGWPDWDREMGMVMGHPI